MPNAFTLFGELRADTSNFESALQRADREIRQTEKNLERLEGKTRSLGNTSAVTARSQERINESLQTTRQRLSNATQAYDQGIIGHRKMAGVLTQTDAKMAALNSRIKNQSAQLTDWKTRQSSMLSGLGQLDGALSAVGLSAVGMAAYIGNAAIDVDNMMNVLRAATGSTEAAKLKLAELNAVAAKSPGVLTSFAVSTYALLRPMKVSEESVNKLIEAFGRIKLSNPSADLNKMAFNLNQLSVAFDLRDVKEAIENFPKFGEILKRAFNLKAEADNVKGLTDELKKLKAEGKITKESFMGGIADAINKDQNLGKLEDTLGTRLEKTLEKVKIRVAPLGKGFLDPFLEEINKDTPDARTFDNLSGMVIQMVQANTAHLQVLGSVASSIWDKLPSVTEKVWNNVTGILVGISSTLAGRMFAIGANIVQGFINGMTSNTGGIRAAAEGMGSIADHAAKARLETKSPSKVFFRIGKDVAQGFIDGIASMRTGIQQAMASVLDISKLNVKFGKGDAPGVSLLTELIRELDQLTPRTKEEEVRAKMTAKAYQGLNAAIHERIILAAKQLDTLKKQAEFRERLDDFLNSGGPRTSSGQGSGRGEDFSDSDVGWLSGMTPKEYEQWLESLEETTAKMMATIGKPPPLDMWANFWDNFQMRIEQMRQNLPSLNEVLGENLLAGLDNLSTGLANALTRWEGGFKGMMKNIALSFAQMAQQIAAEMIRLIILKQLLNLFGSALGGLGGGGASTSGGSGPGGAFGGGMGGWGWGGTGGGGEMAMAGGGTVNRTSNFYINVSGANSPQQTADQIMRAATRMQTQAAIRNK